MDALRRHPQQSVHAAAGAGAGAGGRVRGGHHPEGGPGPQEAVVQITVGQRVGLPLPLPVRVQPVPESVAEPLQRLVQRLQRQQLQLRLVQPRIGQVCVPAQIGGVQSSRQRERICPARQHSAVSCERAAPEQLLQP